MKKVKYVDLYKQNQPYIKKFDLIFRKFVKSGKYILGDYVEKFEKNFQNILTLNML